MPVIDHTKRYAADELADALGWDWYKDVSDYDLYDSLQAAGYEWDGRLWINTEDGEE